MGTIADTDGAPPIPLAGGTAGLRETIKTFTFSNSYTTGGEALSPAGCGLSEILHVSAGPTGGYLFGYDYTAHKLLAFRSGGATAVLTEETATTDLSAVAVRVAVIGTP